MPANKRSSRFLKAILISMVTLLAAEMAFRVWMKSTNRPDFKIVPAKEVLERAWLKPHPYLIYTFKPNHEFEMKDYGFPVIRTNRFGFRSTGRLDVTGTDKSPDTLRLVVVGGSTTMGVIAQDKTWPYLTGVLLEKEFPQKSVEVLNEGIMGYTSQDNLIDLAIRVLDFDADVYVLYLGINDFLTVAPPDVFKSDHSHFRRTFYESLHYSPAELLPAWTDKSQLLAYGLKGIFNLKDRQDLLSSTAITPLRQGYSLQFADSQEAFLMVIKAYLRNTRNMIALIRSQNPQALIVLSSIHFKLPLIKVSLMNQSLKNLAKETGVVFADPGAALKGLPGLTYDDCHFTDKGAMLMAETMSEAIIKNKDLLFGGHSLKTKEPHK